MAKRNAVHPMDGLQEAKPESPIDRAGATELPEADQSPPFPAADNFPEQEYAFNPTSGTRIADVVEAMTLAAMRAVGVAPPAEAGQARYLLLPESYYNKLSDSARAFFHKHEPKGTNNGQ